jgi:hypothetical protein
MGIPGLKGIGSNFIQRMWVAYNQMEDQRLQNQATWEGQKFVASAMADIKKVIERERRFEQQEEDQRQSVRDLFFYRAIGILPKADISGEARASTANPQDKTPADLTEEMRRWVTGDNDWHDAVVQDYKDRITALKEAREKAREENWQRHLARQQDFYEDAAPQVTSLVGYTGDQLKALVAQRNPGHLQGVRFIANNEEAKQDDLHNRWIGNEVSTGDLNVDQEGRVVGGRMNLDGDNVVFVQEGSEVRAVQDPKQGQTLQDRVSGRRVQFHDGVK